MKRILLALFAIVTIAFTACQKESAQYIPDRTADTSIDNLFDSSQCTLTFSTTSTGLTPSTDRNITSNTQTWLFLDSVTTYSSGIGMTTYAWINKARFVFIGTAGTTMNFRNLKLYLLSPGNTQTLIATVTDDAVLASGVHYVQFSSLQDSTSLLFTTGSPQLIKLVGIPTGASGEKFKVRLEDSNTQFFTETGSPNLSTLPVTTNGWSTFN